MRYAIASWSFCDSGISPHLRIEQFAEMGFDTISFVGSQLPGTSPENAREVRRVMEERNLSATIHGGFHDSLDHFRFAMDLLGDRILRITFDAAHSEEPRGRLFDTQRMVPFLLELEKAVAGTEIRIGIEDFPLDETAFEYYRPDLEPLLASGRYGMLVDLGHMNIRLKRTSYYEGWCIRKYMQHLPLEVIEIHVHDNDGTRDQHQPIGLGNLDFSKTAQALKQIGFAGVSTIEIVPPFHGATEEESLPRAKESLERWKALWNEAHD